MFKSSLISKIVLPAVAGLLVGIVWYSQLFFGKMLYPNGKKGKGGRWLALTGSFCMKLWMAYGLAILLDPTDFSEGAASGALGALFCGIFFIVPSTIVQALYQKRSLMTSLIEILYQVISLTVMGAVMYGFFVKW